MIDPPSDDWDTYWKYFNELLTPPPPLTAWGVVPGCESVAELLREFSCRRLLEAASGIGLKAITFRRLGFDVVGMDISVNGVELARQLARTVDIPVEFHRCAWDNMPSALFEQFDAVFIDQVLNARTASELTSAAQCALRALRPGGIFFFGANAGEWEMSAEKRLARHWADGTGPHVAWIKDSADRQSSTVAVRSPYPGGIYHSFLHTVVSQGQRTLEYSGFFENFSWTWDELVPVLQGVGFSQVLRRPMLNGSVCAIAIR